MGDSRGSMPTVTSKGDGLNVQIQRQRSETGFKKGKTQLCTFCNDHTSNVRHRWLKINGQKYATQTPKLEWVC